MGNLIYIISFLFWSLTYLLIIKKSYNDKSTGLPITANSLFITWEFSYVFVFPFIFNLHVDFFVAISVFMWLVLDTCVLIFFIKNGKKYIDEKKITFKYFKESIILFLFSAYVLNILMVFFLANDGFSVPISIGINAYLWNFISSLLFIKLYFQRQNLEGQSIAIAFSKLIGTIVDFSFNDPIYISTLILLIFILDFIYLMIMIFNPSNKFSTNRLI